MQKARTGVVVVEDDLQRQAHRLVAVAGKLHQQTVRLIELEPPLRRRAELLEIGAFEVVSRYCLLQLGDLGFDALGVKVMVAEQAHGQNFRCGLIGPQYCTKQWSIHLAPRQFKLN